MRSKSAGLDFWSNVEVLLYPSFSSGITGLDLKRLQKRALLNHISARPNRNFFRALRTLRDDAHANFGACGKEKAGFGRSVPESWLLHILANTCSFSLWWSTRSTKALAAYQKQHTDFHNTTSHDMLYCAIWSCRHVSTSRRTFEEGVALVMQVASMRRPCRKIAQLDLSEDHVPHYIHWLSIGPLKNIKLLGVNPTFLDAPELHIVCYSNMYIYTYHDISRLGCSCFKNP